MTAFSFLTITLLSSPASPNNYTALIPSYERCPLIFNLHTAEFTQQQRSHAPLYSPLTAPRSTPPARHPSTVVHTVRSGVRLQRKVAILPLQYEKGDWITIQKPGILRKLSVPRLGPYKVLKHHMNGDISYEKEPFVDDKVNIRRTYPYYKKHNEVE